MEELLHEAIEFAIKKHDGQVRKCSNVPYITHIKAVAELLAKEGADSQTIIVGILHDTLEDTKTTIEELVSEFGVEIATMVDTLSEKKSLSYMDRKYMQSLRIKNSCRSVKLVKCADCLSNLTDTYKDIKLGENPWIKFNAGKHDIRQHYYDTICAISELEGCKIYDKLKDVYNKVFQETETKYCTDCSCMKRIVTPDPDDWFCDDDETYICGINGMTLSTMNRPYEKQIAPEDCPLEK